MGRYAVPTDPPSAADTKNEVNNVPMIRERISTFLTTLSLILSLTAASAALPALTLAATPNIAFGAGALSSSDATGATAPIVGTGEVVGFNVWATNKDKSTISQFYLTIEAPSGASVYDEAIPSAGGTCDGEVPTHCTFGQLKPNKSVTVSIAYNTALSYPASCPFGPQPPGSLVPTATLFDEAMCVNFVWSTVGFTTTDPGSHSRGDTFQWHDGVELDSSDDFAGHAFFDSDLLTVQNDQLISDDNQQATKVELPAAAAAHFAWVRDGEGETVDNCTKATNTFDCGDLFGQVSSVNVDNNYPFSQVFTITITIDASLVTIPKSKLLVWHSYIDQFGEPQQELISASCSKSAAPPCLIVTTGATYWMIEIRTHHNGKFRLG